MSLGQWMGQKLPAMNRGRVGSSRSHRRPTAKRSAIAGYDSRSLRIADRHAPQVGTFDYASATQTPAGSPQSVELLE